MSKFYDNQNIRCEPGEIVRKGYRRKKYNRKDGTIVRATYVPPTCIRDRGMPGKGPRTLPRPDNRLHLTKYGYSIHRPTRERRAALRAAAQDNSILTVERRLNLIRNLQPIGEKAKEIMTQDVEYMKKLYAPFSKTRSSKNSRKSTLQKGGQMTDTSDSSEAIVENVDLPEETVERTIRVNTIIDREKVCDVDGKCGVRNFVYEEHDVDGKQVIFYTLDEKDVDDIWELDKKYLDTNETREEAQQKIHDNPGLLIGIKVDGLFQGYAHYDPEENIEPIPTGLDRIPVGVRIIRFYVNKGYRTSLYKFLERYFKKSGYDKVKVVVNLDGSNAKEWINFWFEQGFHVVETLHEKYRLHMEKSI